MGGAMGAVAVAGAGVVAVAVYIFFCHEKLSPLENSRQPQ